MKQKSSFLPIPYHNEDGTENGVQDNLIRIQGKRMQKERKKTSLQKIAVEILSHAKG